MAPRESLSAEVAAMSDRLDRWLAGIEEEPDLEERDEDEEAFMPGPFSATRPSD